MSFDDLKKLLNGGGERLVFIEDGKPSFVVLAFDDYRKITTGHCSEQKNIFNKTDIEIPKQPMVIANSGIPLSQNNSPSFNNNVEVKSNPESELEKRELTLEDLPF